MPSYDLVEVVFEVEDLRLLYDRKHRVATQGEA
jgi:hypothetical protein